MKNDRKKKPTVASLYAGIGGICRAFELAGAKMLWANEFDEHAQRTYRENFKHLLLPKDISYYVERLDELILEDAPTEEHILKPDILTSGFPCQAFSIAGHRLGFEDLRGLHFFKTMSFLKTLQPKAYLFENVKNLQSHNKGDTIKTIQQTIHDAGYSYVIRVLNSMHYGNIPQNRERVFIVGFKDEAHFNNQDQGKQPSHEPTPATTLFLKHFPRPIRLRKEIKNLLSKKSVDKKYYYTSFECYKTLKTFIKKRDTLYQWRRVYPRENKSNVCPTLTANMGTGGHNVPLVLDNKDIRKLTPQECARFQGFKEQDLVFPEMADSHKYKQIGNSVTVPVVKRLADAICLALDKHGQKKISSRKKK
jgi:DNA (cytosine-5)-methyltransferase 1